MIGDENVHRVRALMDEVFGSENFCSLIGVEKTTGQTDVLLATVYDYVIWFAKIKDAAKFRQLHKEKPPISNPQERYVCVETNAGEIIDLSVSQKTALKPIPEGRILKLRDLTFQTGSEISRLQRTFSGKVFRPSGNRGWSISESGFSTVTKAGYLHYFGNTLYWKRYREQRTYTPIGNYWDEFKSGFGEDKLYVVQTREGIIARCILMTTDPGDLVLDPTCGSGNTAAVAEQWGRRWITIDTSRVALALARVRIMGARYPYFLLADSREGQIKEAGVTRNTPSSQPVRGNIRHGFVYERVPHITLKSIANNAEIDVIGDKFQEILEPLREQLNKALKQKWEEWQIPREAEEKWSKEGKDLHAKWWKNWIARQKEIDASIGAKAEFEFLYDKPYEDRKRVRVAGPFTVESLSPHRVLTVDEDDELVDGVAEPGSGYGGTLSFAELILENLRTAGVQQAHKEDRITFTSLVPWPGEGRVCAEGRYMEGSSQVPSPPGKGEKVADRPDEGGVQRRAGIFIGPEFGTVQRADLVEAARECADAGFDVLISCAFNHEAHTTEFNKLGRVPVLKARMNADLHMGNDLKNTGKVNLFVIFGEPDIDLLPVEGQPDQLQIKINGVDIFKPQTGEIESSNADGIACWFIDFEKPTSGRIAVKVINHLGDEVMKVFKVK